MKNTNIQNTEELLERIADTLDVALEGLWEGNTPEECVRDGAIALTLMQHVVGHVLNLVSNTPEDIHAIAQRLCVHAVEHALRERNGLIGYQASLN